MRLPRGRPLLPDWSSLLIAWLSAVLPPSAFVRAALWTAMQLQVPAPTGMVNDFAGVLPAPTVARLERLTRAVKEQSGGEIAVVTLKDLGGREAGDVALEIGRTWKVGANAAIGAKARNAGVVLLVVPKESSADGKGHMFIATGQGVEGFIPDAVAGDIRREAIPMLRGGDYAGAITLMTQRLAERYAGEFGFTLDSADLLRVAPPRGPPTRSRNDGRISPIVFILGFIVLMIVLSAISRRRGGGIGGGPFFMGGGGWGSGGGGWSSGGGGGGFGGFGGGGGFSGGGSGGDW
ncbi:MAG: TPM domain-containing protein [Gemmatimonadetes bacterium]|nr:TPM domain-containing protein [Gemmatimonadota bacterium]